MKNAFLRGAGPKIILGLSINLLFFSFLELTARLVERRIPPRPVDIGLGFDAATRLFLPTTEDPGILTTNPAKRISFQESRFSSERPKDVFRIFALGGSSVNYLQKHFQSLVREFEQEPLGPYRRIEMINAGGLSYGSHRLGLILQEVLSYQPSLILFYEAHNEFEEVEQLQLASPSLSKVERAISHSAFYRLLRDRLTSFNLASFRKRHESRQQVLQSAPDYARAWRTRFSPEDVNTRMNAFEKNLRDMIQRCQREGVPFVIGTVPSNLWNPYLGKEDAETYAEVKHLIQRNEYGAALTRGRLLLSRAVGRHQASDLENAIIRSLAKEYELPLADVETAVMQAESHGIPGETLFMDHCHLNDKGNSVWINVYRPLILKCIQS